MNIENTRLFNHDMEGILKASESVCAEENLDRVGKVSPEVAASLAKLALDLNIEMPDRYRQMAKTPAAQEGLAARNSELGALAHTLFY